MQGYPNHVAFDKDSWYDAMDMTMWCYLNRALLDDRSIVPFRLEMSKTWLETLKEMKPDRRAKRRDPLHTWFVAGVLRATCMLHWNPHSDVVC